MNHCGFYIINLFNFILQLTSFIESLFNDYFKCVVYKKLSKERGKKLLKIYENSGIVKSIDVLNPLLNEDLCVKMKKFDLTFYDKWTSLRKIRNQIIHENNVYISKEKMADINNLIKQGESVFLELKSELYKKGT